MYQWWFYFIKLSVPSGDHNHSLLFPPFFPGYLSDPNRLERVGALDAETSGVYFRTARPMAQDEEFVSSFRRPLKEVPWSNRGKGWKLSHIFLTFWIQVVYQIESWWEFAICYAQTHPFRTHSLSHFGFGKHPWCFRRWFLLVDVSWCCHMFSWEPPFNLTSNLIPLVLTVAKLSN